MTYEFLKRGGIDLDWKNLNEESRKRWEHNAVHWDEYMGNTSNQFHNELIRPATEDLLEVKRGERILDIACGNGNFSRRLSELGAEVVAFDYSSTMIEAAKSRSKDPGITYLVLDAKDEEALLHLGHGTFDAAVSNMALMDMAEIVPLSRALSQLLKPGGRFVFSIMHPCFQPPGLVKFTETEDLGDHIAFRHGIKLTRYIVPEMYEGRALGGQPVPHLYFHRPLEVVMGVFFREQFVLDGFREPTFDRSEDQRWEWVDFPPAAIFRFRKV